MLGESSKSKEVRDRDVTPLQRIRTVRVTIELTTTKIKQRNNEVRFQK